MGQILASLGVDEEHFIDDRFSHIYVRQSSNWDCGIACLSMVLKWSNAADQTPLVFDKSTPLWTIDLYVFLKQRGLRDAIFYTTCKGINRDHFAIDWYKRHIEADVLRVERKFQEAKDNEWAVNDAISLLQIGNLLLQGGGAGKSCVVILLVDNNLLKKKTTTSSSALQYAGHYILLVHFDAEKQTFLYLDPSTDANPVCIDIAHLMSAHVASGTDQDVIVINR